VIGATKNQVVRLQEAVRDAGASVRWVRLRWLRASLAGTVILLLVAIPASLMASLMGLIAPPWLPRFASDAWLMDGLFAGILSAGLASSALGLAVAARRRKALCNRLQERLEALPARDREQVLGGLRHEALADTRLIVKPLLRAAGMPTELSPASAPPGRGDEASPVG
jgi:hypothetical protein